MEIAAAQMMSSQRRKRRLSAIMAVDVVSFSTLMELDEARTIQIIDFLRKEIIQPRVNEHNGTVFKLLGDGVLIEFPSVLDAVDCAASIQKRMGRSQADRSPDRRVHIRIGINVGEVVVHENDLLGDAINVAARLEQLCKPDGILFSGTAYDQLQGKVLNIVKYKGRRRVKNISRRIRVYSILLPPVKTTDVVIVRLGRAIYKLVDTAFMLGVAFVISLVVVVIVVTVLDRIGR